MSKYSAFQKLDTPQEEKVLLELCHAFSLMNKLQDVALLLRDLLTEQELRMIAKRLQIAKLLVKGEKYDVIRRNLKVSESTIARVNVWISSSGEGYKLVITKERKNTLPPISSRTRQSSMWKQHMRKYPLYYLPHLLLEEILQCASKKQQKNLQTALRTLRTTKKKSKMLRMLQNYFRYGKSKETEKA